LTWIKLSFVARVFLDFYIRNFDFWLQREHQKYREIRWLSTLKRFFIVDGTGKKCPQSIIERCPDSRGSFTAKAVRSDWQVSRKGRCPL
jgi:hypothetical protein